MPDVTRTFFFLFGVLLPPGSSLRAADPKSGAIDFTGTKHVKLTIGERLKLETDFHRFEFGGKTSVAANGFMKNTSKKKLYGTLYVAFFDKEKNLVACSGQTFILDAGKSMAAGSVLEMPLDQISKIASYQVRIYEAEKEIGKK